jgi:hypothetical protein
MKRPKTKIRNYFIDEKLIYTIVDHCLVENELQQYDF